MAYRCRSCPQCGVFFEPQSGRQHYCSPRCSAVHRFWSYVERRGEDECWPWLGATLDGYGILGIGNNRMERAHRFAFELVNGRPLKNQGNHSCNNPICCNGKHIYDGTKSQNVDDCVAAGRFCRGSARSSAKLDDESVALIKKLAGEPTGEGYQKRYQVKQSDLAKRFGVSADTIGCILRGRNWHHITAAE